MPAVTVERRADGVLLLSNGDASPVDPPSIVDWLQRAAESEPRSPFLGLNYAAAWAKSGAVASWLIAQGHGPGKPPLAILSGGSTESALFAFGGLRAGVLVASGDFSRPDHALSIVRPALVFAKSSQACAKFLDRAQALGAGIVTVDGQRGLPFGALARRSIDAAVAERRLHITSDTPARMLIAADPAGRLRGLVNTHGNLAAAFEMMRVAGGNAALDAVVRDAIPLHIGERPPLPGSTIKLVPADCERFELRVKGPHVTPGYYGDPAATAAAFDEEGFFKSGDFARRVEGP
jgi:feruloyl-CoA synthase